MLFNVFPVYSKCLIVNDNPNFTFKVEKVDNYFLINVYDSDGYKLLF